jgi:hypothetical protein
MAKTYTICPPHVAELAHTLFERIPSHKPFSQAKVRFIFRFAESDTPVRPLKHNGVPSSFAVEIVPDRLRQLNTSKVTVLPDVIVYFDKVIYEAGSEADRQALMDSALSSIMVDGDHNKDGTLAVSESGDFVFKVDGAGRPVIKSRPADVKLSVYYGVIERNQQHAESVAEIRKIGQAVQRKMWG